MKFHSSATLLMTLLLTACGVESPHGTDVVTAGRGKPLVITSNYPLYYFAREIAGESADVVFPLMDGDPANWKPASEDITQMQSADLVVLNGAAYEPWLNWISLPDDVLLDTSAGIRERLIPLAQDTLHQHGPQGQHSHPGLAFTTWLDPTLATEQARAIEQAISALAPQNRETHRARLAGLEARLAALDEDLQRAFGALNEPAVIFSHPVYQYLAARYQLNGVSMHWEPQQDPGIKAWIEFRETLRRYPANLMIWEGQPDQETASQLGQLGVRPVVFDTASNLPTSSDYFAVMDANIKRISPE